MAPHRQPPVLTGMAYLPSPPPGLSWGSTSSSMRGKPVRRRWPGQARATQFLSPGFLRLSTHRVERVLPSRSTQLYPSFQIDFRASTGGTVRLSFATGKRPMPYRSDLPLAWRRTKADIQTNRVFVRTPYEIELVDENTDEWLRQLSEKVAAGYRPASAIIADIPKGNGGIRPGAILSLEDRTVYADIVGAFLPIISEAE